MHVSSIAEWREPRLKTFACGLNNPHSVAITDNGKYVIVTESQRNCVTVFSAATERWSGGLVSMAIGSLKILEK